MVRASFEFASSQLYSDSKVQKAYATAYSLPSSMTCEITAPTSYPEASQANLNGLIVYIIVNQMPLSFSLWNSQLQPHIPHSAFMQFEVVQAVKSSGKVRHKQSIRVDKTQQLTIIAAKLISDIIWSIQNAINFLSSAVGIQGTLLMIWLPEIALSFLKSESFFISVFEHRFQ